MITRFATLSSRMAVALTMIFAIAACGGGGGGGGGGFLGEGGADSDDTYYLTVQLNDADGNPTSIVTSNSPGSLQVLVTRNGPNGRAIADVIVKASTDSGLLFPSEGSKLTNAEGLVTFRIEAGTGKGAGTIVVAVEDENGVTVEERVNFQIGVDSLRLGYLVNGDFFDAEIGIAPQGPIAAKGEAILSLAIVDENGLPVGSSESVRINSNCLERGDATLSTANPVPVLGGKVELTYSAGSCSGSDQLTAEVIGDGAQAFGTIEIADPTADGLTFISAEPELIVLKGTGGGPNRVEQSKVKFQAVNSAGVPQEGVTVNFALTSDVGGLQLTPLTAATDADGFVSTDVLSGDVATVVRVVATLASSDGGDDVSAVSDVLTVSTGLPDQNSISLSVTGGFVVEEAMTVDGVTRQINVRMADKFNNPVPDGTAAVFTTEYGSIGSSCETVNGVCSVTWTSQAPRVPTLEENQELVVTINDPGYSCPSHNGTSGPCPDDLGMIRGGRSTIMVTAIGEESFVDSNANGVYDEGEKWANLTEAWVDHNENGFYDPATQSCNNNEDQLKCKAGSEEIFTDFNSNGRFDANGDDPANGYPNEGVTAMYNGLLCPEEGDGLWCSRELVNVYGNIGVILSADPNWDIALYRGRTPSTGTSFGRTYSVYVSDIFNNKPTAGSTVTVDASGPCTATVLSSNEVPNTTSFGAFEVSFIQEGEVEYNSCEENAPTGSDLRGDLKITLTPNNGGPSYSESWTCTAKATDTKDGPCDGEGEGGGGGGDSPVPGG